MAKSIVLKNTCLTTMLHGIVSLEAAFLAIVTIPWNLNSRNALHLMVEAQELGA